MPTLTVPGANITPPTDVVAGYTLQSGETGLDATSDIALTIYASDGVSNPTAQYGGSAQAIVYIPASSAAVVTSGGVVYIGGQFPAPTSGNYFSPGASSYLPPSDGSSPLPADLAQQSLVLSYTFAVVQANGSLLNRTITLPITLTETTGLGNNTTTTTIASGGIMLTITIGTGSVTLSWTGDGRTGYYILLGSEDGINYRTIGVYASTVNSVTRYGDEPGLNYRLL